MLCWCSLGGGSAKVLVEKGKGDEVKIRRNTACLGLSRAKLSTYTQFDGPVVVK